MPKRSAHEFEGEDLRESWYRHHRRNNVRRRNNRSRHGNVYVAPQYGPSIYSNQMPFSIRNRIPVMREGGYYYTQGVRMNLGRDRPDSRRYAVAYQPEY